MQKIKKDMSKFKFWGESLCLDFANTVGWHAGDDPYEWIDDYEGFVEWCAAAGIVTDEKRKVFIKKAADFPEDAQIVYKIVIELRETIYRIFRNLSKKMPADQTDIDVLNEHISRAYRFLQLENIDSHYGLYFKESTALDSLLRPIVQSAIDLISSKELDRVKQCEGGTCGWLFVDTSRNRSRRWCSMEDCGNRAKAKRHYSKKVKSE